MAATGHQSVVMHERSLHCLAVSDSFLAT